MVKWFESAGMEKEPELEQIRRMGVVGSNGVHLSGDMCKRTAVYFCSRFWEKECGNIWSSGEEEKKKPHFF